MKNIYRLFLGMLIAISATLTGCRTADPASASFASVEIRNRSYEQIAAATVQVFGEAGYQARPGAAGELLFEKEATRGQTIARDGIAGTYYGAQTIDRVRAGIVPLNGGGFRLQCKAYMVSGGSDPFFQDEVPLANIRSRPYQSLLDKVGKKLK